MAQPFWKRRSFIVVAAIVAIPVLGLAWWLGSPLFFDTEVDEAFPRAALAEVPDDMTPEEVEASMVDAEGVSAEAGDAMPAGEPTVLLTGTFSGADDFHQGSGSATVYELADGSRVLRFEDFEVTNGPDLHVIISPGTNPQTRDEVSAAGYEDLGSLTGNIGNQNYDIPGDLDLSGEWTVVIYCVPFHVLFASAPLG